MICRTELRFDHIFGIPFPSCEAENNVARQRGCHSW